MKTLIITHDTDKHVELLTDLIDGNKEFTVYQVAELIDGVRHSEVSDETIARGVNYTVESYNLDAVVAECVEKDYNLVAYETGNDPVVLHESTYYGGAIGAEAI